MVLEFHVREREQLRDPHAPQEQPDEPRHPDDFPQPDDSHWDVFIPDDDEIDPLPEPGDFWIEPEDEHGAGSLDRGAISRAVSIDPLTHS
jgi:hypothetical protein